MIGTTGKWCFVTQELAVIMFSERKWIFVSYLLILPKCFHWLKLSVFWSHVCLWRWQRHSMQVFIAFPCSHPLLWGHKAKNVENHLRGASTTLVLRWLLRVMFWLRCPVFINFGFFLVWYLRALKYGPMAEVSFAQAEVYAAFM